VYILRTTYKVFKTDNARLLAADVVGVYFMFLICICVFSIVVTIAVQILFLRSENQPLAAMPVWVSRDYKQHKIDLRRNIPSFYYSFNLFHYY